jgi:hypothetical protein
LSTSSDYGRNWTNIIDPIHEKLRQFIQLFFVIGKECFLREVRAEVEGITDNLKVTSESVLCEIRAEAEEIFADLLVNVKDENMCRHQICFYSKKKTLHGYKEKAPEL